MSTPKSTRYLIATGTQTYANLGEEFTLASVPLEIDRIASTLAARLDYTSVLESVREDPSNRDLLDGLHDWFSSPERQGDETIILYCTGHGEVLGETFYLLTSNTVDANLSLTAVDVRALVHLLREQGLVRRLLIIIDACNSGEGVHTIVSAVMHNASLLDFSGDEGIWVIGAARPREEAEQGAFVDAFIRALEYCLENTGEAQEYLSLEFLIQQIQKHLPPSQTAYHGTVTQGGLPPFFPNPRYRPDLPSGVDLDTSRRLINQRELADHWSLKARGIAIASQGGWYFTGRREALLRITNHLSQRPYLSPESGRAEGSAFLVLTGNPGSGKSAVLGRLLVESVGLVDPIHGSRVGAIDSALLARGKTPADLKDELCEDLQLDRGSDPFGAVTTGRGTFKILIDALDEAADPHALIEEFLSPLHEAMRASPGSARVVIGTRRHLLDRMPAEAAVLDLDEAEYFQAGDLRDYAQALLLASRPDGSSSAYDEHRELVQDVAAEIASIAVESFLVAQLAARTLAGYEVPLSAGQVRANRGQWTTLGAAFESDLNRHGEVKGFVRRMLSGLAWGQGSGVPRELWPTIANALPTPDCPQSLLDDQDVSWMIRNAGGYIVEAVEDERAVYRLYHQELIDHLRRDYDTIATEALVFEALYASVRRPGAASWDWVASAPYLRRHLAWHALQSDRLRFLVDDLNVVVAAEPSRLIAALRLADSLDNDIAAVYGATFGGLEGKSDWDRASQLEFTARRMRRPELAVEIASRFSGRPWVTPGDGEARRRELRW